MKKIVEFYVNGELYKSCPYNRWDSAYNAIIRLLQKKGFVRASVDRNHLKKPLPCSFDIYVNLSKYECAVIYAKIFTGHADKNGYKIYDEDILRTPFGFDSEVHQHMDSETYYVRQHFEDSWETHDYDVEDFSQYEKVKDVAGAPKKEWIKIGN